jgi:hypothetical protein
MDRIIQRNGFKRAIVVFRGHLILMGLGLLAGSCALQAADLLTERYDNARTGQNQSETTLSLQNVNQATFGKLFSLPTDGQVYAQPLYKSQVTIPNQGVHNVLYVVTEHGSVYAFDADGNNPAQGYLWKDSFINPANGVTPLSPTDVSASDITPEMCITATPVIDPSTNTLYVVAHTKEVQGGNTNFVVRLHALDITTGGETMNGPVAIAASVPGTGVGSVNGTLAFDTLIHNPRAGLALVNRNVYIGFGSYGDQGPYHGWVIGYNAASVQQQIGSFTTTPNGGGGGIWMSGGGVSADSAGNLYVGAGNGLFGTGNASGNQNYADSLLRLSTSNGISVADSFTPFNQLDLTYADNDVGVSDVLLLPDQAGPYPHILVSADKQGVLYLVNRDGFGGFNPSVNNDIQTIQTGNSLHNSISYYNGAIYIGDDGAPLQAFTIQNGVMSGVPQSVSPNIYGQNQATRSGSSPVITANGTADAIVWALDVTGGPAVLYAYDATDLRKILYSSAQAPNQRDVAGLGVKFTTPAVVNGKAYVEGASEVTVYGLLSDAGPPTVATPVFNPPPGKIFNTPQPVALVDSTPGATIYYTTDGSVANTNSPVYSSPINISGPTTINAFATAPNATASASISAFYTVLSNTDPAVPTFASGFSTAGLALNGVASIAGSSLQLTDGGAMEVSSAFYTTPVDVQRFSTQFLFQITNPNGEGFTFTLQNAGLNALGSPGGGLGFGPDPNYHVSASEHSISNSVAIKFDLTDTAGEGVNSTGIFVNGAAPTTPALDLSASGIDLHSGHAFMARLDYDGANLTLTITDTSDPTKKFSTVFPIDIPGTIGSRTAYAGFTGSTGNATAAEDILQWTYNALPSFSNGFANFGLALNGIASVAGARLQLTDGGVTESGSAFYATPINVQQFATDFLFQLSNADADGMTFVIQRAGASALGDNGGGLGYAGIGNSVAVKFDLYDNGGEGSNSTGLYINGVVPTVPSVDLTSYGINLHNGSTYHAQLSYDGSNLALTLTDTNNPAATFSTTFPIDIPGTIGGTTAFVGFTGGTGGASAVQQILQWNFSSNGTSISALTGGATASTLPPNIRLAGDFDGDGIADQAVWRPSSGTWYIVPSGNPSQLIVRQWGVLGDIPIPGDYDQDGIADLAVWRPSNGTWYIIPSSNPAQPIVLQWGAAGDVPVLGHFMENGRPNLAVWRPSEGNWYILGGSAVSPNGFVIRQWGVPGDIPVPGDYDKDGITDLAVWRPSSGTWYLLPSSNPGQPIVQQWGVVGDIPLPGDFTGAGRPDLAVWRPSNGSWYVWPLGSTDPSAAIVRQWGLIGDIPVVGDFDGDHRADFVVWRPSNGTWYVLPSVNTAGMRTAPWGVAGDSPN